MRRLVAVSAVGVLLAGCASGGDAAISSSVPADEDSDAELVILDPCAKPNLTTIEPGAISFVTPSAPAPPYFLTDEPSDREGLEAALAYELAEELGFRPQEVTWDLVPAEQILTGEFVDFDVAIGGFVARPDEFPIIDYTSPYLATTTVLDVNDDAVRRALLGVGGELTPTQVRFAAPVQGAGRPWLMSKEWLPEGGGLALWARGGLEMDQARAATDARLIDEPTRQWLTEVKGVEISNVAGASPPEVEYSLAMVAGNPLVACVDRALAEMSENGTLDDLRTTWLAPGAWVKD